MTVAAGISAHAGLKLGVRILSIVSFIALTTLMFATFLADDTSYLLNLLVQSFGSVSTLFYIISHIVSYIISYHFISHICTCIICLCLHTYIHIYNIRLSSFLLSLSPPLSLPVSHSSPCLFYNLHVRGVRADSKPYSFTHAQDTISGSCQF